jgi:hypothetical protein
MTVRSDFLLVLSVAILGACHDDPGSQFGGGNVADGSASSAECAAKGATPIPKDGVCPSGSGLAFGAPELPACCYPCKAPDTVVDGRCVPPSAIDCKNAGGTCSEGFNCNPGTKTVGDCNGDVSFARVKSPCCVPPADAGVPMDAAAGG